MLINSWGVDQAGIWDLMTAAIMVDPNLCEFQPLHLQVVTEAGNKNGQTAVIQDGQPNTEVCLTPDAAQIQQTLDRVFSSGWLSPGISGEPSVAKTQEDAEAQSSTPENLLFRDDFNAALQPGWTWENENALRWTITQDGWLQIIGEDKALLYGQPQSNLLWRELPTGDFGVTVHLKASPTTNYQQAAIFLYEDQDNYIAINRGYCGSCLTGGNGIFMEYKINGQFGSYNVEIQEADVYLKLVREEQTISGFYAIEPDQWKRLGQYGNYFSFTKVGLGVSNCDSESDDEVDMVALFDYFEITRP